MMRLTLRFIIAALASSALIGPAPARAAHPLQTDDASTLGRGTFQVELGSAASRDRAPPDGARGGGVREDAAGLCVALGAGLRDDLDVTVGAPYAWSRVSAEGEPTREQGGLGDLSLDLKWRALRAGTFSLALKPGVTLPTGDARRGLGTGRPGFALTAIASQGLGRLSAHANVVYLRDEYARGADRAASRADRVRASAAAVVEATPWLRAAAEAAAELDPDRRRDRWQASAAVAAIGTVADSVDLDAGVKVGLTEPASDLTGLVGVTWRF